MLLEASEAPCCPPACLPASHGLSPSPSPGIRSQTPLAACLPAVPLQALPSLPSAENGIPGPRGSSQVTSREVAPPDGARPPD